MSSDQDQSDPDTGSAESEGPLTVHVNGAEMVEDRNGEDEDNQLPLGPFNFADFLQRTGECLADEVRARGIEDYTANSSQRACPSIAVTGAKDG
jgi:hypothetical protein